MENDNNKTLMMKGEEEEHTGPEDEDFDEEFQCCVCLDLLYKPVVLACGHISCFWCVFKAMDVWHESHCPVCRHPYNHFPNICHLLHFLLLKLYPVAYKRRERQVGEEEKKAGNFSPQFDPHLFGSLPSNELDISGNSPHLPTYPQTKLYSESRHSQEEEASSSMNSSEISVHCRDNAPVKPPTSSKTSEATANATIKECSLLGNNLEHRAHKQVSVADLPCAACKKLLFRPVVLNCGHVYCESCIIVPEDRIPRCQVCQSLHPNGFPSVCLILEHFLEEQFSEIYAERREALLKQTDCCSTSGLTQVQQHAAHSLPIPTDVYSSWWYGNGPKVHIGVGCDFCGMSPIIGERYKCKDCLEKIGFDLCESCYKTPAKILGRFNQQHKPEHKFEKLQPESIRDLIFKLDAERSGNGGDNASENLDVFHAPILSGDVPVNPEDGSNDLEHVSPSSIMSVDAQLDPEDDFDDPPSSCLN